MWSTLSSWSIFGSATTPPSTPDSETPPIVAGPRKSSISGGSSGNNNGNGTGRKGSYVDTLMPSYTIESDAMRNARPTGTLKEGSSRPSNDGPSTSSSSSSTVGSFYNGSGPSRLLFQSHAWQVVDSNAAKERHLLLFNDLLVITKPIVHNGNGKTKKISKYLVKHIVPLYSLSYSSHPRPTIFDSPNHPYLLVAQKQFELDPAEAIHFLISKNVVSSSHHQVAYLLHIVPWHPKSLGKFMCDPKQHNLLVHYIRFLPLEKINILEGLRLLFGRVRVPGDATIIDSWVDLFIEEWFKVQQKLYRPRELLATTGVSDLEEARKVGFGALGLNADLWSCEGDILEEMEFIQGFKSVANVVEEAAARGNPQIQGVTVELLKTVYSSLRTEKLDLAHPSFSASDVKTPSTSSPMTPNLPTMLTSSANITTIPISVSFQTTESTTVSSNHFSTISSLSSFSSPSSASHKTISPIVIHSATTFTISIPTVDPNLIIHFHSKNDLTFTPHSVSFGEATSHKINVAVKKGAVSGRRLIHFRCSGVNRQNYHFSHIAASSSSLNMSMSLSPMPSPEDENGIYLGSYMTALNVSVEKSFMKHAFSISTTREFESSKSATDKSNNNNNKRYVYAMTNSDARDVFMCFLEDATKDSKAGIGSDASAKGALGKKIKRITEVLDREVLVEELVDVVQGC